MSAYPATAAAEPPNQRFRKAASDDVPTTDNNRRRANSRSHAKARAAWRVVQEVRTDLSEKRAKYVIATWLGNGVLVKRNHEDPKDRHDRPSLFIGKRPGDTWEVK